MLIPTDAPLLQIRGATVRKGTGGDRTILHDLHLRIEQGEHTAVLGPNGSGKSSLIRLITQEYRPVARHENGATVQIFGRDRWEVLELRALLGIVSADLHTSFTQSGYGRRLQGLEVAISGFFASRGVQAHHAVTERMRERGHAALKLMEADHLAEKPMEVMSTGEARRVLIARALVSDPPALLLDEPTTGLDVVARHRFMETVRGLTRAGKTVILVTHQIHEIVPEVGRIVLLRAGRVVADGAKEAVLTPANLSAAFGGPLHVEATDTGYYRTSIPAP